MPRNTREWAHRKLDQVNGNLDWALYHLEEIDKVYREQHPEIAEAVTLGQALIVQCQELLKKLAQTF